MPITNTNWLVWNGGDTTQYRYTTSGTSAPWSLMSTSSWSSAATTPTYSVTGTALNYLSWNMGLNPGYDAPVYTYGNFMVWPEASREPSHQVGYLNIGHVTPDQAERAAERERAAREQRQSRITASDRARGLLLSVLTEEQRASYERDGYFEVIGSAGGLYRINHGTAGNVEWIDPATGRVGAKLCAHPSMEHGWLPEPDVAVGQLLALQTDEPAFVRIANVHAGRRPPMLRAVA